jgi:hypothetical protein
MKPVPDDRRSRVQCCIDGGGRIKKRPARVVKAGLGVIEVIAFLNQPFGIEIGRPGEMRRVEGLRCLKE